MHTKQTTSMVDSYPMHMIVEIHASFAFESATEMHGVAAGLFRTHLQCASLRIVNLDVIQCFQCERVYGALAHGFRSKRAWYVSAHREIQSFHDTADHSHGFFKASPLTRPRGLSQPGHPPQYFKIRSDRTGIFLAKPPDAPLGLLHLFLKHKGTEVKNSEQFAMHNQGLYCFHESEMAHAGKTLPSGNGETVARTFVADAIACGRLVIFGKSAKIGTMLPVPDLKPEFGRVHGKTREILETDM
jgi:hypothetical protein